MSKIRCPKCKHEFEINQAQYADFNDAVNKAVEEREKEIKEKVKLENQTVYSEKINLLNKTINDLQNDIKSFKQTKEVEIKNAVSEKEKEIVALQGKLNNAENDKKLEITKSMQNKDKEIAELKHQMQLEQEKAKGTLKSALDEQAKIKQGEIDALKAQLDKANDYKLQMNVKDIGEDLEQYCSNKFNEIRVNTYPNAYFEKDNDTKINKQKGDFIFRDYIGEGNDKTEFISIMFDMKNEDATAKTKQTNEECFKKLDSDRNAKRCEYAVLVSMRELNNPLYAHGITDVSYKYPKMYVVRPQYFLTIISLLRTAALSNAKDKLEIARYQQQNFNIANFEKEWTDWKSDWGSNITKARNHFEETIKSIDASIKNMQKIRDELTGTIKQLGYADTKVKDLTLRQLAKNSPSIKELLKKKKD